MILEIKKFKSPVLKKKAFDVNLFDDSLKRLVLDMKETMEEKEGLGLAANQIGERKRIFVFLDVRDGIVKEMINPKITEFSKEKESLEEGCLSFPNIFINIKRSRRIKVEGFDSNGNKIEIDAEGILARIIQHEIDHLDGVLFFDRLPLLERIKFKYYGFNRYINKR